MWAYLERAMTRFGTDVENEGSAERVESLLRTYLRTVAPTPGFRRRAWREFQRALDPLAPPKPLPPARA